jgi:hypothetical protein
MGSYDWTKVTPPATAGERLLTGKIITLMTGLAASSILLTNIILLVFLDMGDDLLLMGPQVSGEGGLRYNGISYHGSHGTDVAALSGTAVT